MTTLDRRTRRTASRFAMAALLLLASAARARAAEPAPALLDAMAQGKLDADLGHHDAAARTFKTVADAPDAPPSLRGEALARLAAARRAGGDDIGGLEAFDAAWTYVVEHDDRDTLALLVQSLGEPMPSAERWARIWKRVALLKDESDAAHPTRRVVWPDVPPPGGRTYSGHPVSLDFKGGDMSDVFRLLADISGLNVVVFPGIQGKVSMHMAEVPWDQALDRMLAPNGLVYRLQDNVLLIARPEQLGPERPFTGARIDVRFNDRDVREALQSLAASGGAHVTLAPQIAGRLTLLCSHVRWDQAFDIVARTNGLEWSQKGDTIAVVPQTGASSAVAAPPISAPAPPARKNGETGLAELRLRPLHPGKDGLTAHIANNSDRRVVGFTIAACLAEAVDGTKKRLVEHTVTPPLEPTAERDVTLAFNLPGRYETFTVVEIRYVDGKRTSHFRGCP